MVSFLFCYLAVGFPVSFSDEDASKVAAKQLKAEGAFFREQPYYRFVLDETPLLEDPAGYYVTIGDAWRGSQEKLLLLNKLNDLREVSFAHPKVTDDWCSGLRGIPNLKGLYLSGTGVTDRGLSQLKRLNQLEALGLFDAAISDDGLAVVQGFEKLRWLRLSGTAISDNGLKSLKQLKNLEVLFLERTKTSGTGILHLKDLPRLRRLSLSSELANKKAGNSGLAFLYSMVNLEEIDAVALNMADDEFKGISNLKKLKRIELPFSSVTDKGLFFLKDLETLEHLDIEFSSITDKAGHLLAKMKSLKHLNIANTGISDAIIPHLLSLPKLETLIISGTNVSEKGKTILKKKGLRGII